MFFKQSSIASTTLGSKFVILLFLKNSELPKKHAKKENFFQTAVILWKKYLFDLSKVHAIATSILIRNPFGFFAAHDQKGWNHARQDTLFFLDSPPHFASS